MTIENMLNLRNITRYTDELNMRNQMRLDTNGAQSPRRIICRATTAT